MVDQETGDRLRSFLGNAPIVAVPKLFGKNIHLCPTVELISLLVRYIGLHGRAWFSLQR